ncbi:MAG: AAA family ATPase [Eubacterium sp.]|nr:AAA family ATPase [Eubacterium sp.]
MGLFSRTEKDADTEIINDVERILRDHDNPEVKDFYSRYMFLKNHKDFCKIEPFSLYASAIRVLVLASDVSPKNYKSTMEYAEEVYAQMCPYEELTPDFGNISVIFLEMFNKNGIIPTRTFNSTIYDLFNDKFNFMKWAKNVSLTDDVLEYFVKPYAVEARIYFLDEDCFTANLIDVTGKLIASADKQAVYDTELEKIYHMAGIYDVSETSLIDVVGKIKAAELLHDKIEALMKVVDDRVNILDATSRNSVVDVKNVCDDEVKKAKYELKIIDEKLKQAYDNCVAEQKQVVLYEKQKLLDETFAEAEERLSALKHAAERTINTVKLEMPEGLTEMVLDASQVRFSGMNPGSGNMPSNAIGTTGTAGISVTSNANVSAYHGAGQDFARIYEPQVNSFDQDNEIPEVNPLLDESRKFSERLKEAMDRKAHLIALGEHFHEMFDDVLIAVMENANPYLIGPSGCGKTYMVSQIARILEMEFIDIGYINEEYDILGFQTANGGYSRPNFYRCYKYGKIAFCDELDNGNSRATVKLNSFLSNIKDANYSFPNGENVSRHPNFRLIGAGNTDGNGANSNYNSREKIEESVQQRFTPIFINYDNNVERRILNDYPEWYSFVVLFRMATDEWGRKNFGDAPGIITTRDATRIKKYLDNQSFNMSKILDYEFIQTKDITYLAFIQDFIGQYIKDYQNAEAIYKEFSQIINLRRG